jgi:hypothetical protein
MEFSFDNKIIRFPYKSIFSQNSILVESDDSIGDQKQS